MDELRALYESLKLRDAQSYVQSGNVVFTTGETDLGRLATRIESAIEKKFGFRPAVILRSSSELRDAIARNPFATRRDLNPAKLLVTFLAGDPGDEARKKVLSIPVDPEEMHLVGRELYVYYPNGQGRSKFPQAVIDRILKTPGTGRNWNSVTKLMEMAGAME